MKPKPPARIAALDGIRGVAILCVLFDHFIIEGFPNHIVPVKAVFNWTWAGVDLFFVLSGFLLGGLLLENRRSGNYFMVFYVRRACRIFPLYFGFVGFLLIFQWLLPKQYAFLVLADSVGASVIPFWPCLFFIQNFYFGLAGWGHMGTEWLIPTWSLAVEEQFYLLLPAIIRFLPENFLPKTIVIIAVASIASRIAVYLLLGQSATINYMCRWDSMWIGVLAAWTARQSFFKHNDRRTSRVLNWVFWVSLGMLCFAFLQRGARDFRYSFEMTSYGYTLMAVASASLILLASLSSDGCFPKLVSWRPMCWLGRVSFAVYLFHQAVIGCLRSLLFGGRVAITVGQEIVLVLLAILVSLALAFLTWNLFENRIIAFGHRFKYLPAQTTDK